MSHTLSLLDEVRGRLGMYLGTTSLAKLAAFLRGYDYAVEKVGGGKADPFLAGFRDWIQRRYQTTSHSWEDLILRHSKDEADAVRQFWELVDEYRREANGAGLAPGASSGVGVAVGKQ